MIEFARPELFLLLMLVPLLIVGGILAQRSRGQAWRRLVAERLRPILVRERSSTRRWFAFGVSLLALVLLIGALTAPNAGYVESPETIRGRNIIIAIDVSRSMLATDVSPNRLSAARASALELLDTFPNDRIGIVAFSGSAWLHVPLTVDHVALRESFQQLEFRAGQEDWLPRGGSDIARAVDLAINTFKETGQRNNALIVLSDGETHSGSIDDAAEDAEDAGITIFSAGFGTDEGGFIPDPNQRDGKLHDRNGNLVLSRLKSEPLSLLARRTGGLYFPGAGRHFTASLEQAVARLDQFEMEGRSRRVAIPRFQWFLFPSIVLFVVGILLNSSWRFPARPTAAAVVAVVLVGLSTWSEGGIIPRTQAEQTYAKGDHARALELFREEAAAATGERRSRLQLGEGAAAYRVGDFRHAISAYSGALLSRKPSVQEQAHYALGNAHYFSGSTLLAKGQPNQPPDPAAVKSAIRNWEDAIEHFDGALAVNPGNTRARENRDLVRKNLEELQKQQEQQEQSQDQKNDQKNEDKKDGDGQQNEDPNKSPKENEGDPNNEGNQENQPQENPPDSPGESNPEQRQPEQGDPQENQTPRAPEPKPGETPEEYARRILGDNADFQNQPVPLRLRQPRRSDKDW